MAYKQVVVHRVNNPRGSMGQIAMTSLTLLELVVIYSTMLPCTVGYHRPDGDHQICQLDSFTPRCPQHDVIVINRAMYGQVAPNTCFELLDFSDCVSNVLGIADGMCSGIRQCEVMIPNAQFSGTRQCFRQAMSYFEVSYSCLTVTQISNLCRPSPVLSISNSETVLSSNQIASCGGVVQSLSLKAQAGQQINVTLLDFKWAASSTSSSGCVKYGEVADLQTGQIKEMCGGQVREQNLMLSMSNNVRLTLNPVTDQVRYLLKIQALGCPDPTPPHGAWMNRSHNAVTMGCQANGQVWPLRCINGKWAGQVGDCMKEHAVVNVPRRDDDEDAESSSGLMLPTDIIIAIIGAAGVLIAIIIITAGVVCYKQASEKKKKLLMMQKQQMDFQTMIKRQLTLQQRKPSSPDDAVYLSPSFVQERQVPAAGESTYESIHVFNRGVPDVASNANTLVSVESSSGPPMMTSQNTTSTTATTNKSPWEEDTYNVSQSSSSSYTNPRKYYVLDKNLVNQGDVAI